MMRPAAPKTQVSVLVPTYNESQNIIGLLRSVAECLPKNLVTETIVIDDNSPDGTGKIAEEYVRGLKAAGHTINVIHRRAKQGLSSAILRGIEQARGETIIVMDSDFSHPPSIIPKLLSSLKQHQCDIVVASRYARGGTTINWPLSRRILSRLATKIARGGLGIEQHDPMSGFFAFKKNLIDGLKFDGLGYKILLEMLVKTRGATVREVPYAFADRQKGSSKLGAGVAVDFARSVWRLYLHGRAARTKTHGPAVRMLSKAARFYTVGASGLAVNLAFAMALTGTIAELWYVHANLIGILASMSSNFALNKYWTFEDKSFAPARTASQYARFVAFSSAGALVQMGLVYGLVEWYSLSYPASLVIAVGAAAFGNFVLNKKWTFGEKLWS